MLRFRPRIGPFVWSPGPKRGDGKLFGLPPTVVGLLIIVASGLFAWVMNAITG